MAQRHLFCNEEKGFSVLTEKCNAAFTCDPYFRAFPFITLQYLTKATISQRFMAVVYTHSKGFRIAPKIHLTNKRV